MSRSQPNILITGTPGTGKTTTAQQVSEITGLKHLQVGMLVKDRNLHDGYDAKYDTYILNEDKLCDELEDEMSAGGNIVDFHSCDFFPERWFDLVVVLRTDNTVLYPRLEQRGYSQLKITENVECEIMQVLLDEAKESYKEEIVKELQSNSVEELEANVNLIANFVRQWKS